MFSDAISVEDALLQRDMQVLIGMQEFSDTTRSYSPSSPVVIGRVHALAGGGTKSGWQAANRRVGQDLDASVWPFKTKLRHPDRASAMVQRRFLFAFFDPQHPG